MTSILLESHVKGTTLSKGVAIGPLFFFTSSLDNILPCHPILIGQVEKECDRFQKALAKSRLDIERIRGGLVAAKVQQGVIAILDAHLQIMLDPSLIRLTEEEISKLCPAETAFQTVIDHYIDRFSKLKDPFFRERACDIQDISRRVVSYLCEMKFDQWESIDEPSILVSEELSSSIVAELSPKKVIGIITSKGSDTSHSAILARAKGIPYITGVDIQDLQERVQFNKKTPVILDAREGFLILEPTLSSLKHFLEAKSVIEGETRALFTSKDLKAETIDGYEIKLSANIDVEGELDLLHQYGGQGVGLFRSEYVFLKHERFPSEEEQFEIYKDIIQKMDGLPIVIRTFDVGGDKGSFHNTAKEDNPYLGCRAIRFLLKEKSIFRTQLRAILRAAVFGDVGLMFPMVSGLSELKEAKQLLQQVENELKEEGIPFQQKIRLGSMIEVPSAAIVADLIAKECDFLSIGTNDLVQYSLAVDRGNELLSGIYTPTHPGVIRLIKTVVTEANRQGIPVTVCGEIAADPRFTPLLMGLGVHELSVSARYIPIIKHQIRRMTIVRAAHLAEEVLNLGEPQEIAALLEKEYLASLILY